MVFLALLACTGHQTTPPGSDSAYGQETADTAGRTPRCPGQRTVVWGSDRVTVGMVGVTATGFQLGFAVTGLPGGWTGEDCWDGDGAYAWCHHFADTTGTLVYVTSESEVVEGQTTYINAQDQGETTYFVKPDGGTCCVWGQDPAYYAPFGCQLGP